MYVKTEDQKPEYKYRAICMEWRIYSGFKEKTGKRYERYYAG